MAFLLFFKRTARALFAAREAADMRRYLIILAGLLSLLSPAAQAANSTVSAMTAASALSGSELLYCVQSAADRKCTPIQLATYIFGTVSGDLTCAAGGACTLKNTGPGATGPLGSTTTSPSVTIDAQGRVTGLSSNNIAFPVSSVTGGIGVTVSPTTGAVVVSAPVTARNNTATTDTITSADKGALVTESNASSVAVAITTAGFVSTDYFSVKNKGAGLATYTPSSGTIDGAGTLTLKQNQSADIYFDGTNYWTLPGRPTNVAPADLTGLGAGLATALASTPQGNGAKVQLSTGTTTSGDCVKFDVNGNTVDAGAACGAGGGGSVNHPGYLSGNWYVPLNITNDTTGGGGPSLLTAHCGISQIGGTANVTILSLGFNIQTPGSNVQLALYNNSTASGISRPGTLVDSTPSIVSTSGGGNKVTANLNSPRTVAPGFYWLCLQTDNTSIRYVSLVNGPQATLMNYVGSSNPGNTLSGVTPPTGVTTTTGISSFGTWPTFVGATFVEDFSGATPFIGFKIQ
jgi:hypothetical protein